jgi:hypothetical protein
VPWSRHHHDGLVGGALTSWTSGGSWCSPFVRCFMEQWWAPTVRQRYREHHGRRGEDQLSPRGPGRAGGLGRRGRLLRLQGRRRPGSRPAQAPGEQSAASPGRRTWGCGGRTGLRGGHRELRPRRAGGGR